MKNANAYTGPQRFAHRGLQKRLEVTLMDKQTGPNGFLVVPPSEIIEIPQDSDKS